MIEPTSGSMRVLGLDPQADGPKLRARTGVLTESPSMDELLTAWDNLSIYADLFGVPRGEAHRRINELLVEFDLADRAQERVSGYSKGMKQRLALARALLHKPELLFLDEGTSGLDPIAAHYVNELIERIVRREDCTVFMCIHNLVEAQILCDRVAVLEHGWLVALGTPAELTRQYVRRLDLEIEVPEEQAQTTLGILRSLPDLVLGEPAQPNGALADSFAGEKERKTMEALLYTPTIDRGLFVAKLLSGWFAAIAVAFVGFVLYVVTANAAAWSQMHRIFFPSTMWLVLITWLVPALPGLGLGVMVIVSARAQGFQDPYQMGGLVVLPVVLLVIGQVSGLMYFSVTLVFLFGLFVWLLDGLLTWLGSRSFHRGRLIGNLIQERVEVTGGRETLRPPV